MSARERPAPETVLEPVSPEHLLKLQEREAAERAVQNGGGGNLLKAIENSAGEEIAALEAERVQLVARVWDINAKIVALTTHALVSPKAKDA